MKRWRSISVVLLLVITSASSRASAAPTASDHENLVTTIPSDFVVAHTAERPDLRLQEFIPEGQTFQNWTRMITVQIHRGAISPEEFGRAMAAKFRSICPQTQIHRAPQPSLDGLPAARYLFRIAQCDATTPESNLVLFIQGRESTYVILHAWRPRPPTKQELSEANAVLDAMRICAGAPGICVKAMAADQAARLAFSTQQTMWERSMTAARAAAARAKSAEAETLLRDALVEAQRQEPVPDAALETYAALEQLYRVQGREREAAEVSRLARELRLGPLTGSGARL